MSVLVQRGELNPLSRSHLREIEAGGRWVAFGQPDPDELFAEMMTREVRSLVTFQSDLSFLRRVPQLESLVVSSDPRDVAPIHALPNLRSLSFTGTWGGRLDFGVFPKLDSFSVVECPKDDGGLDTLFAGHRREPVAACRSSLDRIPHVRPGEGSDLEPLARVSEPQTVPDRPLPLEPRPQ